MPISAKIIEDSVSDQGVRLATMQLVFPRFILSEFNTHRAFSRNASSSRAIPVTKMLEMVSAEPAMPIHWGQNQAGMQAKSELTGDKAELAKQLWINAATNAVEVARDMEALGLHKQVSNRILEPFQHMHVIVTSTTAGLENFFSLRDHEDAQPEIQALAQAKKAALANSTPKELKPFEWHLPYLTREEVTSLTLTQALQVSAARCCRVSYLKHDGTNPSIDEDLKLYHRLAGSSPIHASPLEHQATPIERGYGVKWRSQPSGQGPSRNAVWVEESKLTGNFQGWIQHRKLVEYGLVSNLGGNLA